MSASPANLRTDLLCLALALIGGLAPVAVVLTTSAEPSLDDVKREIFTTDRTASRASELRGSISYLRSQLGEDGLDMMPLEDSRDEVEHQLAALVIRSRLHGESNRLPATTIDGATHAPLAVTIDGSLDGMIEVHRRIEQIWPIKLVTRMALTRRGDGLWHEDLIVDVVYGP